MVEDQIIHSTRMPDSSEEVEIILYFFLLVGVHQRIKN